MSVEVDFDQTLVNFEGNGVKDEEGKPVRLGFVAGFALSRTFQGDDRDEKEQESDWELSQRIGKSNAETGRYGPVTLKNKEAGHIEEIIRKVYPMPLYAAQCARLLEADDTVEEAKEKE
jgi:hypothetical protein